MGRAIGIDLGTTFSATAVLRPTGVPEILNNADGDATTPSVVLFQDFGDGDEPVVGAMAKHQAASAPLDVVQFVKRHMGDPHWRFDAPSGATFTAEEVSAIILKRLKQDAELALGEEITDAVVTVPAYFDDARRTATLQAGKIAGLNVLRILNEPTAAALAYGLDETRDGTVLVYDLGGGTFDVTLTRIHDTVFDVVATDGDRNLGGFDFDNALIQHVADELERQGAVGVLDDLDALALLRERAEMAKRTLTTVASTNVNVTFQGKPYRVKVSRADFEHATKSLLNRTRELVEDVLEAGGIGWKQIDHVLLVGGSTRMPMIRAMVEKLSGKKPATDINPDEAVALGAAIQAAIEQARPVSGESAPFGEAGTVAGTTNTAPFGGRPVSVRDVTSQALGVIVLREDDPARDLNLVVIPRNTKVPAKESRVVLTTYDDQDQVEVRVTQGDDEDPEFVVEIGRSMLSLPPYPKGSRLRVTYHYDVDQTVYVELDDLTAGRSLGTFQVERVANLTDAQVEIAEAKIRAITVG